MSTNDMFEELINPESYSDSSSPLDQSPAMRVDQSQSAAAPRVSGPAWGVSQTPPDGQPAVRSSYDLATDTQPFSSAAWAGYDYYRAAPQDCHSISYTLVTQQSGNVFPAMTSSCNSVSTTPMSPAFSRFGHRRASSDNERMNGIVSRFQIPPLDVTRTRQEQLSEQVPALTRSSGESDFASASSDSTPPAPKKRKMNVSRPAPAGQEQRANSGKKVKQTGRHDPVNHEIFKLVTEDGLKWQRIADVFNARDPPPETEWTEAGVYNRFKRNAPPIAKMKGIRNFDVQQYVHMLSGEDGKMHRRRRTVLPQWRPTNFFNNSPRLPESAIDLGESGEDQYLAQAYQEVVMQTQLWQRVSKRLAETTGTMLTAEECERRITIF